MYVGAQSQTLLSCYYCLYVHVHWYQYFMESLSRWYACLLNGVTYISTYETVLHLYTHSLQLGSFTATSGIPGCPSACIHTHTYVGLSCGCQDSVRIILPQRSQTIANANLVSPPVFAIGLHQRAFRVSNLLCPINLQLPFTVCLALYALLHSMSPENIP